MRWLEIFLFSYSSTDYNQMTSMFLESSNNMLDSDRLNYLSWILAKFLHFKTVWTKTYIFLDIFVYVVKQFISNTSSSEVPFRYARWYTSNLFYCFYETQIYILHLLNTQIIYCDSRWLFRCSIVLLLYSFSACLFVYRRYFLINYQSSYI